jgi:hypothetical protein
MESGILNQIVYQANMGVLTKKLRLKEGSRYLPELQKLAEEAQSLARPKAAYPVGYIEEREDNHVVIDGTTFSSRILSVNLQGAHRVFFYLATCGTELEQWSQDQSDMLYQFWADAIKEQALRVAHRMLNQFLDRKYQLGRTSSMAPGSLEDWPITQQQSLFALMDGLSDDIGVRLTDSMLMLPVKSISGLRFPTETRFESCQLCPRENCPGRRAKFEKDLFERKYS